MKMLSCPGPVLVALLAAGCSLATRKPPTSTDPAQAPRCSESKAAVALDSAAGGVLSLIGAVAVAGDDSKTGVIPLLLGGVFIASALAGNSSANKCIAANDAHEHWLEAERERMSRPATEKSAATPASPDTPAATRPADASPGPANRPPANQPPANQPPANQPIVIEEPEEPYDSDPDDEPGDPAAGPATPAPASRPRKQQGPESTTKAPDQDDESWDDFWREVTP